LSKCKKYDTSEPELIQLSYILLFAALRRSLTVTSIISTCMCRFPYQPHDLTGINNNQQHSLRLYLWMC